MAATLANSLVTMTTLTLGSQRMPSDRNANTALGTILAYEQRLDIVPLASRQTTHPRTLAETLSQIAEASCDAAAAYRCCLPTIPFWPRPLTNIS